MGHVKLTPTAVPSVPVRIAHVSHVAQKKKKKKKLTSTTYFLSMIIPSSILDHRNRQVSRRNYL